MKNKGFFEFLYTWTPSKFSVQQLAFFAAMIAMTLEKVEKRWQRSGRRRRRVVFGKAALGRGHQTLTPSSSLSSKIPIKLKTFTITLQNPRALWEVRKPPRRMSISVSLWWWCDFVSLTALKITFDERNWDKAMVMMMRTGMMMMMAMTMITIMMVIYIYIDEVSFCHEKWALPP